MGLFKKIADYQGTTHGVDPTGHSHSQSEGWLSTIVSNLTALIQGKADVEHWHTSEDISEILGSTSHDGASLNEVIDAFDNDIATLQTELDGKADASHTHAISTITGLQSALDGKLDSNITEMSASAQTPIVVDDLPVGGLIMIDNPLSFKLSQLIVVGGSLGEIHYHLNSGDLTSNFFLVRKFTWRGGAPIGDHNLIEVVGAWD